MSDFSFPLSVMISFAETSEELLGSVYFWIRNKSPLNIVCFYIFVLVLIRFLYSEKNKSNIIFVKKILDDKGQKNVKEKLLEKMKEVRGFIEELKAEKKNDLNDKIDQAMNEIKKIQDLHNEFKEDILDSHTQIIDSLTGNKKKIEIGRNGLERQGFCNDYESIEQKNEENLNFNYETKQGLVVPEVHISNPFAHNGIKSENRPQKLSIPIINKYPKIPRPQEEVKNEKIEKNDFLPEKKIPTIEKKSPSENLIPNQSISKPITTNAFRPPPIRGKGTKPISDDRSKYIPPQSIKSNPFG